MRRALSIAVIALCFGALAGCGEKDEPETTGPVATAESSNSTPTADTTVTTTDGTTTTPTNQKPLPPQELAAFFLTGVSPRPIDVCTEGLTASFLKDAYGDEQGCLAARKPASLASEANLTVTPPNGNRAAVTAEPTGGVYDGDKLQITLVKEGDTWLIDSLESNAPVGP